MGQGQKGNVSRVLTATEPIRESRYGANWDGANKGTCLAVDLGLVQRGKR